MFEVSKDNSLPLHIQLLDDLRHKVFTGLMKPHERLPSEWELVTTLKISRATIQRAWQAAESEGLLYRIAGKGTFVGEPRPSVTTQTAVGLIVPDFRSTSAVQILSGAERVLRQRGYHVRVASTEYSLAEEGHVLCRMREEGVKGCILWAVKGAVEPQRLAVLASLPVVLIDRPVNGLKASCVTSNNYAGGLQAMQHLIELGHRRIVFLARPYLDLWTVAERYRAYQDALLAIGETPLPPILIGDDRELSSYDAYRISNLQTLEPLVARLGGENPPTAVFAVNDWMAIRALRATEIVGLRVPEDVSLMGFDNLEISDFLTPPLTTIAQNTELMGAEAARRLLALIEGETSDTVLTLLPTTLVLRRSTAPPKGVV